MKRLLRTCCIIIFAFVLVFTSAGSTAFAKENEKQNKNHLRNEYINSVLDRYLSLGEVGTELIKISTPINVNGNDDDESRIYFIVKDDYYYGQLVVTEVNGNYYSSFSFDNDERINDVIRNNVAFALIVIGEDTMVLQTKNENIVIAGDRSMTDQYMVPNCTLNQISFSNHIVHNIRATRDYYVNLQVSRVANASSPNGQGLCWAACVAAVSNYRMNTSYSALDIYNALDALYGGTPTGNNAWIALGYSYCGMICTYTSGMSFSDLYFQLSTVGRPAIFGVYRTGGAHSVVCKYLMGGDEYATYGFMDPNKTNTDRNK